MNMIHIVCDAQGIVRGMAEDGKIYYWDTVDAIWKLDKLIPKHEW